MLEPTRAAAAPGLAGAMAFLHLAAEKIADGPLADRAQALPALTALAQTGKTRSPLLQDVPTFDELGVADFDMVTFTGLFGPAGISPPVMDKLTAALQQAMASPAVRERFAGLGVDIITLDRAAFQQYVIRDYANSVAIGKAANIIINE